MEKIQFTLPGHPYNFWPVYDAIHQFYPIGIPRCGESYFQYPGIKALDKLVVDILHHQDDFYKSWDNFTSRLSSHYNLEVRGTTYGQAPSVSADLILEKVETDTFRKVKKISMALSLVGKFFTIYGIDETAMIEKSAGSPDRNYYAVNAITVSPYQEFKQIFSEIKIMVEERYEGYKFIPFSINDFVIKGLQVRYLDEEECTVSNALFNQFLNPCRFGMERGDRHYGFNEWLAEGASFEDIQVTITSPI